MHAYLVGAALSAPAVLTERVAVVRHEDDHCLVQQPFRLERLEDLLDRVVDREEARVLLAARIVDVRSLARREVAPPARLVGHVGLVEGRGVRDRLAS